MNQILIEKLRAARIAKNLRQSDVASLLNVKKNTISNWENGKSNPDIDSLVELCRIYNISCAAVLEEAYADQIVHSLSVSGLEKEIIIAYRKVDEIGKAIVLRSLGIDNTSQKEGRIKMA